MIVTKVVKKIVLKKLTKKLKIFKLKSDTDIIFMCLMASIQIEKKR